MRAVRKSEERAFNEAKAQHKAALDAHRESVKQYEAEKKTEIDRVKSLRREVDEQYEQDVKNYRTLLRLAEEDEKEVRRISQMQAGWEDRGIVKRGIDKVRGAQPPPPKRDPIERPIPPEKLEIPDPEFPEPPPEPPMFMEEPPVYEIEEVTEEGEVTTKENGQIRTSLGSLLVKLDGDVLYQVSRQDFELKFKEV